mmetsp:Transcript_3891/g.9067  ORF Transcript_3891/g.9067 Transcript_3891/m.9067 type:complete len:430 (-) Transcript_3891:71-1360(-)
MVNPSCRPFQRLDITPSAQKRNSDPLQISRPGSRGRISDIRAPFPASGRLPGGHGQVPLELGPDAEVEREYGGRFLPEYTKRRLLGRGACGAVWLALSQRHGGPVAVKQVAKKAGAKSRSDEKAANTEIAVGELFFLRGGSPRLCPVLYPGIRHITALLDFAETKRDLWLVMEFGGAALSKTLFEIKGEFMCRGTAQPRERIYRVHHLPFYCSMKRDPRVLKRLLRQLLEASRVLADHDIVHSDMKPENILVELTDGDALKCEVRLCDFGSAFAYDRPEQLTLATPEYMPPEALESCAVQSRGYAAEAAPASHRSCPWSFDMWSIGAILLELCFGAPHWLSYRCRVLAADGVKDHATQGLFAVPGRDPERIRQRQRDVTMEGALRRTLKDAPGIQLDEDGLDLLAGMLDWDPECRISPEEALAHPYLAQ